MNRDTTGETAWGVKVTYDFKGLGLPGLIAYFWFAQGTGAINPSPVSGCRIGESTTST